MGLTHDCLRFIPVSRFVSSTPLYKHSAGVIYLYLNKEGLINIYSAGAIFLDFGQDIVRVMYCIVDYGYNIYNI